MEGQGAEFNILSLRNGISNSAVDVRLREASEGRLGPGTIFGYSMATDGPGSKSAHAKLKKTKATSPRRSRAIMSISEWKYTHQLSFGAECLLYVIHC
jgi:hypothetical protein